MEVQFLLLCQQTKVSQLINSNLLLFMAKSLTMVTWINTNIKLMETIQFLKWTWWVITNLLCNHEVQILKTIYQLTILKRSLLQIIKLVFKLIITKDNKLLLKKKEVTVKDQVQYISEGKHWNMLFNERL